MQELNKAHNYSIENYTFHLSQKFGAWCFVNAGRTTCVNIHSAFVRWDIFWTSLQ